MGNRQEALQRTWTDYRDPSMMDVEDHIVCDWEALRTQLLYQWQRLTAPEVDSAGPSRRQIARLVERKYGIASICVENYLRNFERALPL